MKTRAISSCSRVLSRCVGVALCVGCCAGFLALPDAAPALTGSGIGGDSECVRFKAGREVKSGDCGWSLGITEEWYLMFNEEWDVVSNDDTKRFGMAYECRPNRSDLPDEEADKLPKCLALVFPPSGDGERYCAETDVMPGETCALTLDGKPAAIPENPPRPSPAWLCLEKIGTDEAMCMKRRNPFPEGEDEDEDEESAEKPAR